MSQILQLIQQQNNRISALQALIEGSISRGLLYAVAGDHIVYGCRVTQGASAADMYLALDGEAAGDSDHLNPDIQTPAMRIEEYPNLAMVYGRAFAMENINTSTTDNAALLVADAPGTAGHGRYDIVYIYVNNTGPAIGIATGTASYTITALSTDAYPVAGDPALVHGCFPIARVYVEYGATGIADADIADLRDFSGRLKGEKGDTAPATVLTWDGDQIAVDGVVAGPHLTGPAPLLTWDGDQIAVDGVVAGPHLTGPAPLLTWDGDQIAVDGVVAGPHLTGPTGNTGMGFVIAKTYVSVAALEADTEPTGIVNGQFAIVDTGSVEDAETGRLYLWNDGYSYITDLSGTTGITGNGISSITLISGTHAPGTTDTYRIYFTNGGSADFTVYNGLNGEGAGDMLAEDYDSNNDGKVNAADVADALSNQYIDWDAVSGGASLKNKPTIPSQYTDEMAQAAVAEAIAAGTHTGISIGYDDETNSFNFTVDNIESETTGFSITFGETPKTLTVDENVAISELLTAIASAGGVPQLITATATLAANKTYVVRGTQTVKIPALAVGENILIHKEYGPSTAITITSDEAADPWTYGVRTTGSTETYMMVGTGTLRPAFNGSASGFDYEPPGATTSVSSSGTVKHYIHAANYAFFFNTLTNPGMTRVNKSTGAILYSSGGAYSATSTSTQYYDSESNKLAFFYSGLDEFDVAISKIVIASSSNLNVTLADIAIDDSYPLRTQAISHTRLSDSLFIFGTINSNACRAMTINWTTNAVSVGSPVTGYAYNYAVSATQFITHEVTGAGQAVKFKLGSVSGTTITLGSLVSTAETGNNTSIPTIIKLADGKFVYIILSNSPSTTLNIYGLTISGSTLTVSSRLQIANVGSSPVFKSTADGNLNEGAGSLSNIAIIDSDRFVITAGTANGIYVVKFTGGVLSIGTMYAQTSPQGFLRDMETGSNIYLVYSTGWKKLSFSDTDITEDYTVSSGGQISCVFKEGLTNREFKGSDGNWYTFSTSLYELDYPITASMALDLNATSTVRRNITI